MHTSGMYRGDITRGFTLIEMLVVLAIIAIVITLSTPLSNIYRQNRVSSQVQEFVSSLNIARNEAVSRSISVSITCIPSNILLDDNGDEVLDDNNNPVLVCEDQQQKGTIDWGAGWIVYTDNDPSDCAFNAGQGDTIIGRGNGMPQNFTLRVAGHDCIKYTASGVTPATSGVWTLCDPSGTANLRRGISLSVAGRALILDNQRAQSMNNINLAPCPTPSS